MCCMSSYETVISRYKLLGNCSLYESFLLLIVSLIETLRMASLVRTFAISIIKYSLKSHYVYLWIYPSSSDYDV